MIPREPWFSRDLCQTTDRLIYPEYSEGALSAVQGNESQPWTLTTIRYRTNECPPDASTQGGSPRRQHQPAKPRRLRLRATPTAAPVASGVQTQPPRQARGERLNHGPHPAAADRAPPGFGRPQTSIDHACRRPARNASPPRRAKCCWGTPPGCT